MGKPAHRNRGKAFGGKEDAEPGLNGSAAARSLAGCWDGLAEASRVRPTVIAGLRWSQPGDRPTVGWI